MISQYVTHGGFWAHMIKPVYLVKPFDPVAAVTLIVLTAVIAYVFGFLGAMFWNRLPSLVTRAQKTDGFWQAMPSRAAQASS
jgi:hypothetical protein